MFSLSPRFALLFLLCTLSMQWLAPINFAQAVAVSRPPPSRRSSPRAIARNVHQQASQHTQRVLPWAHTREIRGSAHHHKRMTSNPFSKFADAVLSGLKKKSRKGTQKQRRGHNAIMIPSTHGDAYMIPHARRAAGTPLWMSQPGNSTQSNNSSSVSAASVDWQGVPGVVQIKSHFYNATEDRTIASLFLTDMNGSFILNASDDNATQLYLVPAPSSSSRQPVAQSAESSDASPSSPSDGDPESYAYLIIPALMDGEDYCATYDPNPPRAGPMTMEKCFHQDTGAASDTHASQTFAYDKPSGVIRPTWFAGQDDGTHNITSAAAADDTAPSASWSSTTSASSSFAAAAVDGSTSTITGSANATGSSIQPSSTASLSTRADTPRGAQNVTLVFVPSTNAVAADVGSDAAQSQSQSLSATSTATPTPSSSASSVGVAAASVAPSASTSSSAAQGSASGLSVELVGDGSVPQSSSVSVSASPTSSPTSTASVNAAAVAASIAASASSASGAPSASSSVSSATVLPASGAPSASSSSVSSATPSASPSVLVAASAPADTDTPSATPSATRTTDSGGTSVISSAATETYVAAVMQREAAPAPVLTGVSTAPYVWRFAREEQ